MLSTMPCPVDSAAGVLVAAGALGAPAFPVGASCPHPITPTTAPAATIIASPYPRLFIVTSSEKAACPLVQLMRARSQPDPTSQGSPRLHRCSGEMPAGSGRATPQFGPHRTAAGTLSGPHCRKPLGGGWDTC